MWGISQLAEELIASEDGLRSVEVFHWVVGWLVGWLVVSSFVGFPD